MWLGVNMEGMKGKYGWQGLQKGLEVSGMQVSGDPGPQRDKLANTKYEENNHKTRFGLKE